VNFHPDALLKFFSALSSLHSRSYVHADLKPANLMWSSYDGCFKLLDFGLTFHTDEQDLHQIQSTGTLFIAKLGPNLVKVLGAYLGV